MMEKIYFKTRLRPKGQITVPGEVRAILGAEEGDDLVFHVEDSGQVVISRARTIPPDQAWFWTERWQKMEREVQEEIDAGEVYTFDDVESALKFLKEAAGMENAQD